MRNNRYYTHNCLKEIERSPNNTVILKVGESANNCYRCSLSAGVTVIITYVCSHKVYLSHLVPDMPTFSRVSLRELMKC